jgi:hypothetical protein
VVGIECERERIGIAHRCGDFIMLAGARSDDNPERNIAEYKEDHANSPPACFQSYSPQSGNECVDSEKLVGCVSIIALGTLGHKEDGTNQDAQAFSDFGPLHDYALCCAIRPSCDDSIVRPPDIEEATHGLPHVES